jgi:hypothetical protein
MARLVEAYGVPQVNKSSIIECEFPKRSVLDPLWVEAAYFQDSYRAPLHSARAGVVDIFLAIFAHHPRWMKFILVVRHRIAALFGLEVPRTSEVMNVAIKDSYRIGDRISVWPIYALTAQELVAGRDNKHLDFRLSILKDADGGNSVVVSTICVVHNWFGKAYLACILPFHKFGVRLLLARAVSAGRI